jgi:glycosyltransferase involved in cell wall biosynthesis
MSVYNGAPWVATAVASVLAQADGDLELVVMDDGSTDATPDLLVAVVDPRLRVHRQARTGLTRALNRGLGLARGALVARLDADDLALPERLARQRAFLATHPDVGLLGTAAREVDEAGALVRIVRPPTDDAAIRRALIRANPFVHSSVMARRELLARAGGYDETLAVAQDYDLWMRLARVTRLANLDEVLVVRRLGAGRVSIEREEDRLRTEARVRWRAVTSGAYPPWCALFALRPALALALPRPLRHAVRACGRR